MRIRSDEWNAKAVAARFSSLRCAFEIEVAQRDAPVWTRSLALGED
jgi:hypothetical protein